jgi:hypothetical protein
MAEPNQSTPGSHSRKKTSAALVGERHRDADVGPVVEEVKDMGTELLGAVRDGATSLFEEQRRRAAGEIAALGDVLRRSAQSLDRTAGPAVAQYTDEAGRQISQFADTLRTRSLGQMAGDIEDFARRWPIAFMTAAVGVGVLAGRFLISSASRPAAPQQPQPVQTPAIGAGNGMAGGGRHDYGTVGGAAASGANSGYGATGTREAR